MWNLLVTPEWAAAVLAALSLIVSAIALWHSRKTDRENLSLQAAVTRIEETRHRQEQEEAQQANVSLRLINHRRGYVRLRIANAGRATASNVDVSPVMSKATGKAILLYNSPFPISQLHAGEHLHVGADVGQGLSPPFEASLSWNDPRGPQVKKQTLTYDEPGDA